MKISIKASNNCIPSIDNDEQLIVHSKSDNIKTMINDEAVEFIK